MSERTEVAAAIQHKQLLQLLLQMSRFLLLVIYYLLLLINLHNFLRHSKQKNCKSLQATNTD